MDKETEAKPSYYCSECGRSFKNAGALGFHTRSQHKKAEEKSNWAAPEPGPIPSFDTVPEDEILPKKHGVLLEPEPGPIPFGGVWVPEAEIMAQKMSPHAVTGGLVGALLPVVKVKRLPHYQNLPDIAKATPGSAAYDLYAAIEEPMVVRVGDRMAIPTGLAIELPIDFVAKVVPRSGLAMTNGITLLNSPGIIDSDYRGEIKVIVINHSTTKFFVQPGMRIAQMMIEQQPVVRIEFVDAVSSTSRGSGGFGSTGTT